MLRDAVTDAEALVEAEAAADVVRLAEGDVVAETEAETLAEDVVDADADRLADALEDEDGLVDGDGSTAMPAGQSAFDGHSTGKAEPARQ